MEGRGITWLSRCKRSWTRLLTSIPQSVNYTKGWRMILAPTFCLLLDSFLSYAYPISLLEANDDTQLGRVMRGDDNVNHLLSTSWSAIHVSPDLPGVSPTHPPGAKEKDRSMVLGSSRAVFEDEVDEVDGVDGVDEEVWCEILWYVSRYVFDMSLWTMRRKRCL